jgi:uncharacterized protein YbaR (Trm112 family)
MNLLLTDHLTCPGCQEGGGLILLADRIDGRRVLDGQLGCPNCRAKYRVKDGVADFGEREATAPHPPAGDAMHLAALLGVVEGPAMQLVVGPYEQMSAEIAELASDVEIIVATAAPQHLPEREGVSVLRVGGRLPLRDGSMRGVMITGADAEMIGEAVRVTALAARIVLIAATPAAAAALRAQSVHVMAAQDDTLVVVRHY